MYDGPERRKSTEVDRRKSHNTFMFRYRWKILTAWIVLFSATSLGTQIQNRHRVDEIQQARIASCQRTYEAFIEVFEPFFPSGPEATPDQLIRTQNFKDLINDKKANCGRQTQVVKTDTNG